MRSSRAKLESAGPLDPLGCRCRAHRDGVCRPQLIMAVCCLHPSAPPPPQSERTSPALRRNSPASLPCRTCPAAAAALFVAVAVRVAVRVAVDAALPRDRAGDHVTRASARHDLENPPQLADHRPAQALQPRDDDQPVGLRRERQRVADPEDGRRVDDHRVVGLAQLGQDLRQAVRRRELARVRRQRARDEHVEHPGFGDGRARGRSSSDGTTPAGSDAPEAQVDPLHGVAPARPCRARRR